MCAADYRRRRGRSQRGARDTRRADEVAFETLLFFSDAVFAIAITLLALDLRLPAGDGALLARLRDLGPAYYSFGTSFLAIGLYWMGHHRMFRSVVRYDAALVVLNLLLLMCVAFVPFPSAVIGEYDNRTADVFYALTLAVTGLVSAGLWLYASAGGRLLAGPLDRRAFH